jgi:hypothetical protein
VAGPDTDLHAQAKKGVRWRLVAQTDDVAEAYRLHALLQLQRECRELWARGSKILGPCSMP